MRSPLLPEDRRPEPSSWAGRTPTTPSGRTRPSPISPRPVSSPDGKLSERRPSVERVHSLALLRDSLYCLIRRLD